VRRFAQLTADEQARAVDYAQATLGIPADVASDPTIAPRVQQLAQQRARSFFYLEPGDQVVTLPPPPPTTP
jgi:hypothetical protein